MSADDTQSKDWVSRVGVAWALDEAPCPADLLPTLVAIARRAGPDGRGSWQSPKTIAKLVGRSPDTVREDIKALRDDEGLIVLGDQSIIPDRIHPTHRPIVYDLVLGKKGPKKSRKSKNPSGRKKSAAEVPPGLEGGGGLEATPGLEAGTPPGLEGDGSPGLEAPSPPGLQAPQRRSEEEVEQEGEEEQDQKLNPLPSEEIEPAQAEGEEEPGDGNSVVVDVLEAAHRLAMVYRDQLSGAHFGMLRGHLATALTNGWTSPGLAALLAEDHSGLGATTGGTIGPGLIARVKNNPEPPPPLDPDMLVQCPIGGHYDYQAEVQYRALRCSACWSEVRQGQDPFRGHHEPRHPRWVEIYGFDPPAAPDSPRMDEDARAEMLASVAELAERLGLGEQFGGGTIEREVA